MKLRSLTNPSPTIRYGLAIVITALALLLTLTLAPFLGESIFAIFLAAVMLSAWHGGLGPGLVAAGLSAFASLYVLLPPRFELLLSIEISVRLAAFLGAAVLISALTEARRRSERAAYDAQERYAVTLDSIGDAVIVTDREGRITLMNPVAQELTGWPLADGRGRPIGEVFRIINETTRRLVETPVERALREGRVVGLTNHTLLVARDGAERPIDDSGAPVRARDGGVVGAVLVFRDVSARRAEERAREEALRRERAARDSAESAERRESFLARSSAILATSLVVDERLQALARLAVSAIADLCVVYLRLPDGSIRRAASVHVNPEREQTLRALQQAPINPAGPHPAAQVIRSGTPLLEPPVPDAVIAAAAADPEGQAALRALIPNSHLVVPLIARGITLGAFSLGRTGAAQPFTPADMLLAEELAQRAALAVDNARLYEEAQAAIHVRDRFLSLAAHELRTPLTATLGNLQLARRRLAEGAGVDARLERPLRLADEQLCRLDEMITTLLDVSRLEGGQLSLACTRVDVCALARRVVEQLEGTLTRHTVRCETLEPELLLSGDPMRLEQVLANLLQNAVKYSPDGGAVTVRVGQQGERGFIAVVDGGVGIPAEALSRLFERFYRAPDSVGHGIRGMGIGLYVVHEIVTLHGGTVEVESVEGEGSTFIVWLPLARASASAVPGADVHAG